MSLHLHPPRTQYQETHHLLYGKLQSIFQPVFPYSLQSIVQFALQRHIGHGRFVFTTKQKHLAFQMTGKHKTKRPKKDQKGLLSEHLRRYHECSKQRRQMARTDDVHRDSSLCVCVCPCRESLSTKPQPGPGPGQANQTAQIHQADAVATPTLETSLMSGKKSEQLSLFPGRQPRRSVTLAVNSFL